MTQKQIEALAKKLKALKAKAAKNQTVEVEAKLEKAWAQYEMLPIAQQLAVTMIANQ